MKFIFYRNIYFFLILFLFLSTEATGRNKPIDFNPNQGENIILLGNTFADRMRYYGYFETLLQKSFPDRRLTMRNMGWSGDEVGLQPRPLNFPGFRQDTFKPVAIDKAVTFQRWSTEKVVMPVPLNFAGLHQDLREQKADIIFLCFGMNESFKGKSGLPQFETDLLTFIKSLQEQKYNGKSAPKLILVSPIAHEDLGGYLPKPDEHNANLAMYTKVMQGVAEKNAISFIDLFAPSLERMQSNPKAPLTINGIHLNDKGYQEAAQWMSQQLGFNLKGSSLNLNSANTIKLREVIKMKDQHFFYRWRAVNGEYIYGRRREPFGVLSYPPEMQKLNLMVSQLDTVIWQLGKSSGTLPYKKALSIIDQRNNPVLNQALAKVPMIGSQHGLAHDLQKKGKVQAASIEQFTLPEGYAVNLFASEKDFPVEKPVSMAFDAKGRLWVATMPTYPQYFPGIPAHDKIVILEDTNGDGKADKHTVFADDLYLPLGFEFANGGIYVSQEPDILFLKDTTGDDKADLREVILMGFGSEDSHHAMHAFTFGQDGALYFNEGTFLNSQVETPYGPVRSYSGATYRYEPRTGKLSNYISYGYFNPWGSVFDRWGMHLVADASDGSNYYATPMTGKIDYPHKHTTINTFTTTRVRPTAGIEIVSSSHFPDQVQGNFLVNNNIGFQGIKQHEILTSGSGISSKEVEPLLQSSDPNFRPIDLKFGPDGALYVVDWFNPLISHGENPLRDPLRDKSHGRIWRISYKHKPVLQPIDVSKQDITQLLDNLKAYEDRFRYRSRAQIREQASEKVVPALEKWVSNLDKNDPEYEHHLLEALWLYQDFDVVKEDVLRTVLNAKDYRARAAATRVLLYWRDRLHNPLELLQARVNDESPRVRIEAIVAFSYFDSEKAITAAADVLKHPTDYHLDYAIKETFNYLKPVWLASFEQNQKFLAHNPQAAAYLLSSTSREELLQLPQTPPVLTALLNNVHVKAENRIGAIQTLAKQGNMSPVDFIIETLHAQHQRSAKEGTSKKAKDLTQLLLLLDKAELQANKNQLMNLLDKKQYDFLQAAGYAALITAEGNDKSVWKIASKDVQSLINYLLGISLLNKMDLQSDFYEKVKELTREVPRRLAKKYPKIVQTGVASPFYPLYSTAYEVLFSIPGNDKEKMELITDLIKPNQPYLHLAIRLLTEKNDKEIVHAHLAHILDNILTVIQSTAENERNSVEYIQMTALGKRLAGLLPQKEAKPVLALLQSKEIIEVKIVAIRSRMAFDKELITIPAGRSVSLIFDNVDVMPHNLVIIQPGSAEKVGKEADAMASLKDGFEKNFVPAMPEVLFATPLVNAGKSFQLNFIAPDVAGDYPFICSFPGHWRVMKGIIKVVKPALSKSD